MALKMVRDQASGIRFYFKYDPDAPELLHIYARHLTDENDALATYFDPHGQTRWNAGRQRFETCLAANAPKIVSAIQAPTTGLRWWMTRRARRSSIAPRRYQAFFRAASAFA